MSARNKFLIILAVILAIASAYYFFSTPRGNDLVLVGTVDANQIVVSPQIQGRILKLFVEEGTQVKQGDLIALLDPSELEAEERASAAMISSMRSQVSANEYTRQSTKGSTSSDVENSQAKLASARAQVENATAQMREAEVRLGYTKIYAPVTGTVLVRAAREGEVVNAGQAIVTVVDFSDTWVFAAIPETDADHIGIGDTMRVRLPGGTVIPGKVFYKAAEADFATQRDVGRRKRDIRTIALKVRLDNPKGAYVPGMTAEVLVSPDELKGAAPKSAEAAGKP